MKNHLTILCLTLATLLWPAKLFAQEPYAVLSDINTVLTFYYDDQKEARGGMDVGPFDDHNNPSWFQQRESIKSVVFDASFNNCKTITSTAYWFCRLLSLTAITGLEYLNTGNVTDMRSMFYYCSGLTSLDVTHFDTGNVTNMGSMFVGCSGLTSLDVSNFNTGNVTDMRSMFYYCRGLTSLDVTHFDTGNVTDMGYMFSGCSGLTSLDVTNFNAGNVTDMSYMFYGCSGLTALDVTNFDTGNVTNMGYMFSGCSGLTSLDVTHFNTGNVTNMGDMFAGCSGLTALDVTNFDTGNVTNMGFMFAGCSSLTALDVTNFNTGNVTGIGGMFQGCSSLTALDVTNFDTGNVTNMSGMFSGCSGLTSLDVTNFNTGNVTNMAGMFSGCSGLTSLDVTNFDTGKVTYMSGMFRGCSGLTSLDVTGFKTDNVTEMGCMFEDCSGLTSLDLSSFNTSMVIYDNGNDKYGIEGMFSGCSGLTTIYVGDGWTTTNLTQSPDVFKDCTHLVGGAGTHYDENHTDYTYAHIDGGPSNPGYFTASGAEPWTEPTEAEPYAVLSDDNTVLTFYYDNQKAARNGMSVGPFTSDGIPNTSWYFQSTNITSVVFDPSFADCNTITSTAYWFYRMNNLSSITGLEYLNTSNVTDMRYMFYMDAVDMPVSNDKLTSLDVSHFDTSNVTNMSYMFADCVGLTSLDLSHFDTSNVTNMELMFQNCAHLTSLDLSNFNTSNVTNMQSMFYYCTHLTSLDLSHFNTSNVTNMEWMFRNCSGLTTIYVGTSWSTQNVTASDIMFTGCTSLVGGNGTAYDPDHTDSEYARIDKPGEPGYFTDKNAPVMTEAVATPTFVINDNTLTISTTTSGASIHYTMDGTTPTAESTLYSGAIILTHNCTVRAIAVKEGMENSEEGTLEVGGLTKTAITPKPTISREGNTVAISIPGISENYIDATASVAVEPASWGGSAPKADLSGEWTCTVYNGGDVSETYPMTLNSDGSGIYPDPCLSGSWTYNNGTLTLDHFKLSSGDNYNYDIYSLTATNPDNPIEFTGTRTRTVGNAWTENNSTANVKLTYNGTSLGVKGVTTDDGRETTAIIADEGDTEKTGTMLQQSVTGLDNGYYTVEMFAKSQSSSAVPMATDVTYLFANGIRLFIPVEADREIKEHNIYQIGVEVTDGTLNLGLGKEKNGANWHALQIKSLRRHALATDQPIEATAYYTLDGTTPTTSSPQYTTPIELTQSCTVKAIAVANSYLPSEVAILEVEIVPSEPEPYAVLSDNNTVLTFYYDEQKAARGGMDVGPFTYTYDGSHISDFVRPDWFEQRESITTVVFDGSFANCTSLTSTAFWFYRCENLTSIEGIQNLKTDNVTDMGFMFDYCSSLTSLDVSGFNTSKVERFCGLFSGCSLLTSIDVSHFDTSNVWDFRLMFSNCSSLTELNVSNFNTEIATAMGGMFQVCSKLTKLDLRSFNTENVFGMGWLFSGCSALTDLDISTFKTSSAGEMNAMFANCTSLTNIDVRNFDTSNVTLMQGMFYGCEGLTSLDVSHFNTGNVMDMGDMFGGCSGLTSLDVTGFKTDNVTDMDWMFEDCSGLTSLDLSSFNTSKVIYDEGNNKYGIEGMFSGCSSLTTIYVGDGWTTTNLTQSPDVFKDCTHLVGGAGTHYDENHTDYTYAHIDGGPSNPGYFTAAGAEPWTEPNADPEPYAVLSDNNTVLTFYYDDQKEARGGMGVGPFYYDSETWDGHGNKITTVVFDISFADYTTLTNMNYWFSGFSNLTTIQGMENLHTDNLTRCAWLFDGCSSLKSIDLSHFKTDEVTYMRGMFIRCPALEVLDLSTFNTAKATDMMGLFADDTSLQVVYVGEGWTVSGITDDYLGKDMFENCTKLVGGKGTTYDENHTDYSYAHIDGGTSNPGYFTDKNAPVITQTVATPTFNVNGNDLSIVSTTDGASIYYTTDGTDPTTASTLYTIPVNLTQNCTVKAFAVKDGCIDSDVATFNVDWFQVVVRIIQNGTTVEMEATPADAEIHYTTDGSEPTAESILYTEPLTPATDMTIRAIGLRDGFNASDIVSFNYSVGIVTVATPTFTANEAANTVSIETATEGATIYYTLDGSEPTTASTLYNGPVVLTRNCTVKAIAVCEGYYDSYVSSFDVNWFYAERPVMALDYASGTLTITCATAGSIIYYIIGDGETQAYNGTVTLTDNSTVRAWATAEGYDDSAEATLKPIQNGTADGQTFRISGAVTAQELLFLRNVMGDQVEHLDMADATLTDGGLADEAFRGMGLLTAQLPKSVGTVGAKLFDGCRRLAAIVWNAPTDITATALEGIGNPNLLLYVGSEATGSNAGVRNRIVNGTAQEITLSDPTATSASDCNFFCPIAFTANHISYSHIYTQQTGMDGNSRGWETLALPFDVKQVEHRVKGAVAPFGSSLDAPHFWLYSLGSTGWVTATTIAANSPYIIAMPQHPDYAAKYCLGGDSITFSAANAAVPVTAPQQATAGAKTLHANFTAQAASDDIFAINISDPYDDTHPEGSIFLSARRAVRPFEAYTTTTASGVRFIELFDDEADGIMEIECAQRSISDQSSNGYDLSGRRIADGQHRRQLPHKRLIINRGKVRTAK